MIKYFFLFFILIILFKDKKKIEKFMLCPMEYNEIVNNLEENFVDQLRGYTPNDYLYLTENVRGSKPIPVNANFLNNKY